MAAQGRRRHLRARALSEGWRLVHPAYADRTLLGEGARLHGGRWNEPGTRVVYLSEHLSLATLEVLVHARVWAPVRRLTALRVEYDPDSTEIVDRRELPQTWWQSPAPPELASLGSRWARERHSLSLVVPSAVVPQEHNILLNPDHPAFHSVRVVERFLFALDSRLSP